MYVVHIYAESDSPAPRSMERTVGYVLECTTLSGKTATVEGFWKKTGTYHAVILQALVKGMGRLNQSCEVHIHTQDTYILEMVDKNLHIWAGNGFRTAKGELVKNHFEWSRLWDTAKQHLLVMEPGMHPHYNRMQAEMARQ